MAASMSTGVGKGPRLALAAAMLVAATLGYELALHSRWPGRIVRAVRGQDTTLLDVYGGVGLVYAVERPVAGDEARALERAAQRRLGDDKVVAAARVRDGGTRLEVELLGLAPDEAEGVRRGKTLETAGPLELRLVAEDTPTAQALFAAARDDARAADRGVRAEADHWSDPQTGASHRDVYLVAPDRAALELWLAQSGGRAAIDGAGLVLGVEKLEWAWQGDGDGPPPGGVRSYLLEREVQLDNRDVAGADVQWDERTGRPEVRLDFTGAGGDRFEALTARAIGRKLAIVVDHRVISAPLIQSRIPGGTAIITLGGKNPDEQLREGHALAAALRTGPLPARVTLETAVAWEARAGAKLWPRLAATPFAMVGALAILALARLARRRGWAAAPATAAATAATPATGETTSRAPWLRLTVTLVPLPLLHYAERLRLPGLDTSWLPYVPLAGGPPGPFDVGLTPVLLGFVLVELVVLAVPAWRPLRHAGPAARAKIERAALAVGLALTLAQAWTVARLALSAYPTVWSVRRFELVAVATLVAGTACLVVAAQQISRRGLMNGYAALLVAGVALDLRTPWRELRLFDAPPASLVLSGAVIATVAAATVWLVRHPARARPGAPGVATPTPGFIPLVDAAALFAIVSTLAALGVAVPPAVFTRLQPGATSGFAMHLVLVLGFGLLWARLLSWPRPQPGLVAEQRERGADPATLRRLFWRATGVSLAWLALVVVADAVLGGRVRVHVDLAGVVLAAAALVDGVDEWRARRRRPDFIAVWPVHGLAQAEAARVALAEAGIPAWLRTPCLRALLHVFGPWAPVVVHVPAGRVAEAQERLARLWHAAAR
jgi:hypothetical protein